MTEKLRAWLIALVATAFLIAAAERICPESGAKKLLRFSSGLLFLIVLLSPVTRETAAVLAPDLRCYQEETERLKKEFKAENAHRAETLIQEKTKAYIETRAAERGLLLQAELRLRWEDEIPVIDRLILHGCRDDDFAKSIAADLGLDEGSVTWEEGEE